MTFDRKYLPIAIASPVLVVVDQLTKAAIRSAFDYSEGSAPKVVVPGFFNLVYSRNTGGAFHLLGEIHPDALRIAIFLAISAAAVWVVLSFARRAKPEHRLRIWSLALVLGGAIGNLIDRVIAGRVTDFLEVYSRSEWLVRSLGRWCDYGDGRCVWPAFNVADSCICVGVTLLLIEGFVAERREKQQKQQQTAGAPPVS